MGKMGQSYLFALRLGKAESWRHPLGVEKMGGQVEPPEHAVARLVSLLERRPDIREAEQNLILGERPIILKW